MASCYRLPLSASALLLWNFHVFVHTLQLHIVGFISPQHLDLIKIFLKKTTTTLTADIADFLPNNN